MKKRTYKRMKNRLYREIKARMIAERKWLEPVKYQTINRPIQRLCVRKVVPPHILLNEEWAIKMEEKQTVQSMVEKLIADGFVKTVMKVECEMPEMRTYLDVVLPEKGFE